MSAKYKPSDYEVLRRRCVELKEAGWKQKDIALALGLTEGWVSQTLKKYRDQGPQGLVTRKPTGYPPKITPEQLSQLVGELEQGAVSHGFPSHIWTRSRVNALIGRFFGVSYDPTQVGRILKRVGWNGPPLRPTETRQEGSPTEQGESPTMARGNSAGFKKKLRMRAESLYTSTNQDFICSRTSAAPGRPGVRRPSSRRRRARNT